MIRSLLPLLALLALSFSSAGAAQAPLRPGEKAMAVSLVAESKAPPEGGRVTLALLMKPRPGWHGYWKNPGDAGVETRIDWRLPPGVKAGPIQFPVPDRLIVAGFMNYVYKGDYAHLIDVELPPGLAPGTSLPLRGRLDYVVCTDQVCVPESADLALDLAVGRGARDSDFDRYREAMPRPLGSEGRFERVGDRMRLAIPIPRTHALADPYFFPVTLDALDHSAAQTFSRAGDLLIVETKAGRSPPAALEGVLRFGGRDGIALIARPGTVPPAGTPLAETSPLPAGISGVLLAFAAALLGGLLLNVMPCVFPILSLKALSLAGAGGSDERAARRDALAYTTGAVLTCLALGAVLLALRSGGSAAGWAFQLQDPRVILFLLLLVAAIALNLIGLFELPAAAGGDGLTRRGGASGSFWTGALAAFVATPCTGPFMGAALGAALFLPAAAALAIFAGLGLGLALPFLLLGFLPFLRRRLPRPGPWMLRFRRILSLPMALTALALAWVLWRQTGRDGLLLGIAAAFLLAAILWWAGRRRGWLRLAPAALAIAAAVALAPAAVSPVVARARGVLEAKPFSEERLARLRAEGRPVFVYFTADWCVTCKVNEAAVLETEAVARAFKANHVAILVGDWTRGDAEIGRFIQSHDRAGVPLYLWYAPGKEAEVLPQILTTGTVTALVQ